MENFPFIFNIPESTFIGEYGGRSWDLPGGHRLWWRKGRGWELDSTVMVLGGGGIHVKVPLGQEAPGILLYTITTASNPAA